MGTLLAILIPAGLVIAYTLCRLAIGRPLQRHTVDVLFALLVLGYFATTVGLGIFWVANQELPVFDLHYLFGYVTLALIIVHVALNWRTLVAVSQCRAPQPRRPAGRRTWRSAATVAGWSVALVAYGGVCFWFGHRQGTERIEITMAQPPSEPRRPDAMPDADEPAPGPTRASDGLAEGSAGSPDASRTGQELPAALPARHQLVRSEGRERILAVYYHESSSYSRRKLIAESPGVSAAPQPSVFKQYRGAKLIGLPEPAEQAGVSVGAAIDACRRSVSGFSADAISLEDLSTLLFMTNGVTSTLRYPGLTYHLRAAPSAGALYPTVTYVLARNVEGLPSGLYHYAVKEHKLHQIRTEPTLVSRLAALAPDGSLVEQAPATVVFTSIFFRSAWKYRGRAYRYCCLDAGHLAVQAQLAAAALGYGSRFVGRYDDRRVNALLGVDEGKEGSLLIMPLGRPLWDRSPDRSPPTGQRPMLPFTPQPQKLTGPAGDLVLTLHGRTYFQLTDDRVAPFPPRVFSDKEFEGCAVVPLSAEPAPGDDLFPTIRHRRSIRRWAGPGLTLDQLSSVLYHAFGVRRGVGEDSPDVSVEDNHAVNLYVVVNDVQGLDSGAYYYRRHEHALSQIRVGDYQAEAYGASLLQEVVGECHAWLIVTIDRERFGYPDADRGYRYAGLDAGMLGGRVYLQTTGLGRGCCGVGAFYDDEVAEIVGVDPEKELVLYTLAIGVKSPSGER